MRMGTELKEVCLGDPRDHRSFGRRPTERFEAILRFPDRSHEGSPTRIATKSFSLFWKDILPQSPTSHEEVK